jgi:hypothetical protein
VLALIELFRFQNSARSIFMKFIALGIAIVSAASMFGPAAAKSSRADQMLKLDPTTRIEQRCDARAMASSVVNTRALGPMNSWLMPLRIR